MKARVLVAIGAVVLLGNGCNRGVGRRDLREQNNRLVLQAYENLDRGEYRAAGRLLREALDMNPTMARPHLDLAIIFHEHRRDYVRAIYHYQRYIELRPGTEKKAMIRERIEQARAALVVSYGGEALVPPVLSETRTEPEGIAPDQEVLVRDLDAAQSALEEMRQEVRHLHQTGDALRVELADREEQLQVQREELEVLRREVRRLEHAVAQTAATDVAEPRADGGVPPRDDASMRTYRVRANDSLSGIAAQVYGDATKWRLIQEANREVLGNSEVLRVGQVLVIPAVENRR